MISQYYGKVNLDVGHLEGLKGLRKLLHKKCYIAFEYVRK